MQDHIIRPHDLPWVGRAFALQERQMVGDIPNMDGFIESMHLDPERRDEVNVSEVYLGYGTQCNISRRTSFTLHQCTD